MSDLMYDPDQCRNITLDIRYCLFVIDKFAGAGRLINEMNIKRNDQPDTNLRSCLPGILLLLSLSGPAQVSVHREQSLSHAGFAEIQDESRAPVKTDDSCRLNSMVFGYHPYWVGNVWQNYRWNLLSDLCYFSYEVDPSTGNALSTNSWETNPVIDTALSHGTRVHLCITLFGSHSAFFNNAQARQNLINNTIDLLSQRGASGVNLDFEAVPGSLAEAYNSYIAAFADSLHAALPGTLVSIASPAVDWDGLLDIPLLSEHLDFFMIMGYDYYRNGSSVAGPVSGLYPMTGDYPYSVSRTLAWYLSEGAPCTKAGPGITLLRQDLACGEPAGSLQHHRQRDCPHLPCRQEGYLYLFSFQADAGAKQPLSLL
jgi:hypothetical protein